MDDLDALYSAREAFGIRLGLDRIRLLLGRLGDPQRSFRAIHIVGTNGKSSTTRFCAAILEAHGLRSGAYLSPHIAGLAERVQIDGESARSELLDAAASRVAAAAAELEAELGEPLTQFEVLTAAAFTALADAGVEAAAIEAGLGGRFDATNVLDAPVVVLTNVGLDHVAVLGPTRELIAAEKLAVVAPGATVVAGGADAELAPIIERLAGERGAGRVVLLGPRDEAADAPPLAARGRFQRGNLALALTACEALLGERFDRSAALAAAARVIVPGRLEIVGEAPLVVLDAAHNPDGARTLAAELPALLGGRSPVVGVLALLADKDLDGVVLALAPLLDRVVATATPSPRARRAEAIAAACAARGLESEAAADPLAALAEARAQAGTAGAVVVCGSLTLLEALAAVQR